MNDIDEVWSLPWHALQRRLAATYRPEVAPGTPAGRRSPHQPDIATAGSWLVRARRIAAPTAVTSR